jgi:predicted O-methyltransferase YrrM
MTDDELTWLAEQASRHKRIIEIGSWLGRSTRALADNTDGFVEVVDTWAGSDEEEHKNFLVTKPEGWLFNEFTKNMEGTRTLVVANCMTSLEAAALCWDSQFDMIFIDAAHDYESTKADILAWRPLLAPGGILSGHDYGGWPGVTQAVDEVVPNHKRGPFSIWYAEGAEL